MVGDLVLARNETTGAYGFKPIAEVFRHRDPVKLHLTLEDPATGTTEVIETTPGHEFHSPDNGFVAAVTLKPGDLVSRADHHGTAARLQRCAPDRRPARRSGAALVNVRASENTKRFKQAQLSGSSMVVVGRASFISASRSPIVTIRPAISTP
ncbi:MAG: hypothetical protein HC888_15675 [Candidatus Competibacteraceae bacterium]|nr:hypothetical protein [Candidatus Competibacteraceae bacterium]